MPAAISAINQVSAAQVLASVGRELREWGRSNSARWLGYLSSTSVYGDWGGAWVNEGCGSTHNLFMKAVYSQHGIGGKVTATSQLSPGVLQVTAQGF